MEKLDCFLCCSNFHDPNINVLGMAVPAVTTTARGLLTAMKKTV